MSGGKVFGCFFVLRKGNKEKEDLKKKGRNEKKLVGFTGWSHKEMLLHSWECAGYSTAQAQTAEDGATSRWYCCRAVGIMKLQLK